MKLDILVLAVHPDDAELGCGGTIAKHISLGDKVGIIDFTRGELGTRGTAASRAQEAQASSDILKLSVRKNLELADGFFTNTEASQRAVIRAIRSYQPAIILANAIHDRHPDHGRAAALATDACFLSGLAKIETTDQQGNAQAPWRPRAVYHFIQSNFIAPDFIVDVADFWEVKLNAIRAFKSQFHNPTSTEPETYISSAGFMQQIESRAIELGRAIGTSHGEGFTVERFVGVKSLKDLI